MDESIEIRVNYSKSGNWAIELWEHGERQIAYGGYATLPIALRAAAWMEESDAA